jgi:beta-glucosidase
MAVPEIHELCDAVLQAWYPGCEGGRAVADVLFGATSPSGKMPVTVPRSTGDLPAFEDYGMRGRTYRFARAEPLYPFGFGLSYAKFSYDKFAASSDRIREGGSVTVRAAVTHAGGPSADEVVQCYLVPPQGAPEAPRATLVGFEKISLSPGNSVEAAFKLPSDAFRQVDSSGRQVLIPGRFGIVIGSASPGRRAQALGAPAPVSGEISVE